MEAVCLAARSIVNDTPREESDNALIKESPTAYGNIKKKEQKDRAQPETFYQIPAVSPECQNSRSSTYYFC